MKTPSHKWIFRQRVLSGAFGWRGSKLAIQRLKEAVAEIKAVARTAPETLAEGPSCRWGAYGLRSRGSTASPAPLGNGTNKKALAQDPGTDPFVREQLVHGTRYVPGR